MKSNQFKTSCKQGFTLIELLVVVLIIGILAAVAVPQYQLAIEKSKASAILPLLGTVGRAAQQYELATGNWVASFEKLDVKLPDSFQNSACQIPGSLQCKSNGEWTFAISQEDGGTLRGTIYVSRTKGSYKGGGFFYAPHKIYSNVIGQGCLDVHIWNNTSGDYCKKIWKMRQRRAGGTSLSFF